MNRSTTSSKTDTGGSGDDYASRLRQLQHSMESAARAAGARGEGFEGLRAQLFTATPDIKVDAARALRHFGATAVEPLCLALRDPDLRVRTAVVESLGELEDPRAILPLVEALRAYFAGHSARHDFWLGAGVMLTMWTAMALTLAAGGRSLYGRSELPDRLEEECQKRNDLLHALTTALGRIGERHPSPELRSVLPDLKVISRDVIQQRKSTRTASRQAVTRIEAMAARLDHLPLPADTCFERARLPYPSAEAGPEHRVGSDR